MHKRRLLLCVLLSGCSAQFSTDESRRTTPPVGYRVIIGDVQGTTAELRAFDDTLNGVVCYSQSYIAVSCVKVKP